MTFQPVLPWAILAVVTGALTLARAVALWRMLLSAGPRRARVVLRWSGVTLAVLLLIGAATRPIVIDETVGTTPVAGENLNVILVVDRSTEMRDNIAAVLDQYPAARFALITFSSRASLEWPLSDDVWSLRPTVAALSPVEADSDASLAGNTLQSQLAQAAQQYPSSQNVVLYYGSAPNDAPLRAIAEQSNVPYVAPEPGMPVQLDQPDVPDTERIELYWLLALLAAGLLLVEIYLSVREFRRGRIARRDKS